MNLLMVGGGAAGSWVMRGEQLGAALGARVAMTPTAEDFAWADLVVLVKRAGVYWAPMAHQAGTPIVWDALDFWQQPGQNGLSQDEALALLHATQARIQPVLTIGATEAMAAACGGVYLPHHAWEGLTPTPAREQVQIVAYQGNRNYLHAWRGWLEHACARRGWRFIINPPDLRQVDILVAFRGGEWGGWMCREWKSGVKAVNAIAAGRPLISQASAAVRDLEPDGSVIEQPAELDAAFDFWTSVKARQTVVDNARDVAPRYTLQVVAARYVDMLSSVATEAVSC